MATKDEIDLTGDGGGGEGGEPTTPKRVRAPRGPRPSSAKADEAAKALEATLKRVAGFASGRSSDLGETLKRDAPKMASVVGHQAAKNPGLYKVIILLFGPGSVAFAIEAFGPTLLQLRNYLRDRRAARLAAWEAEHPEEALGGHTPVN